MSRHYTPVEDRLWLLVDVRGPDECWEWQGVRLPRGYGRITGPGQQKLYTHRAAYEIAIGPIPDGLWVLHRCDNPPCCNPAHLFLGTTADNTADMDDKGRRRSRSVKAEWTHCARGHEFTEENTIRRKDGRRRCRTCANAGRRRGVPTS